MLLGVGAVAAHGRGSLPLLLGTLSVVALAVDFGWYEFDRRRGARPDSTLSLIVGAGFLRATGREPVRAIRRPGHARREVRPGVDDDPAAARRRLRCGTPAVCPL